MLAVAVEEGKGLLVVGGGAGEVSTLLVGVAEVGEDDALIGGREVGAGEEGVCGADQLWELVAAAQIGEADEGSGLVLSAERKRRGHESQEHTTQHSPHGRTSLVVMLCPICSSNVTAVTRLTAGRAALSVPFHEWGLKFRPECAGLRKG